MSTLRLSALAGLFAVGLIPACAQDAAFEPEPDAAVSDPADVRQPDAQLAPPDARPAADAPPQPDAPPAVFTPRSIPSLALWLEGSTGVSTTDLNRVTRWADQSGNGNHATQESATLQPILLSSAINNRPGIYFDMTGAPVALRVGNPVHASLDGDFTVMVVFRSAIPSTSAGELFRSEDGERSGATLEISPPEILASITVDGLGKFAAAPQSGFDDGEAHVVGMRRTAGKLEVFADGASASVLNPPAGDVSGQIIIGGQIKGPICEVVLATEALDTTTLAELTSYLQEKYALD